MFEATARKSTRLEVSSVFRQASLIFCKEKRP
jgi:hypothetical protein